MSPALSGTPRLARGRRRCRLSKRSPMASSCGLVTTFSPRCSKWYSWIDGLDDRVDRAALFAEAAEDALEQVDVVARGATLAVARARCRVDGDRQRRAHRLAQLAGDAALFAVGVATQRMQAAEAVRLGDVLHRVAHRVLGLEHVAHGQAHALEQLDEQQALEIVGNAGHGFLQTPVPMLTQPKYFMQPATRTHAMVMGMNTFQPSRMIWS